MTLSRLLRFFFLPISVIFLPDFVAVLAIDLSGRPRVCIEWAVFQTSNKPVKTDANKCQVNIFRSEEVKNQEHLMIAWSSETHSHEAGTRNQSKRSLFFFLLHSPKRFAVITAGILTVLPFSLSVLNSHRMSRVSEWLGLYEHSNGLPGVHAPHPHQQPTYGPHAHPARHCGKLESNRLRRLWHSGQVGVFFKQVFKCYNLKNKKKMFSQTVKLVFYCRSSS